MIKHLKNSKNSDVEPMLFDQENTLENRYIPKHKTSIIEK